MSRVEKSIVYPVSYEYFLQNISLQQHRWVTLDIASSEIDIMDQYKSVLAKFMDFFKGTDEYTTSAVPLEVVSEERLNAMTLAELTAKKYITAEELYAVRPEDIEKWMIKRAYGIDNTSFKDLPADARVMYLRSETLEFYKKALSYFMPNQMQPWNEVMKQGNPRKVHINKKFDQRDTEERVTRRRVRVTRRRVRIKSPS
jgi:hypothetical protein